MDTRSVSLAVSVGDRVVVEGFKLGTVRYVGGAGGMDAYIGVELDNDVGDSDGVFRGRRYFTCPVGRGVLRSVREVKKYLEDDYNRTGLIDTTLDKYVTCRSIDPSAGSCVCSESLENVEECKEDVDPAMQEDQSAEILKDNISLQRRVELFNNKVTLLQSNLQEEADRRRGLERRNRVLNAECEQIKSELRRERRERDILVESLERQIRREAERREGLERDNTLLKRELERRALKEFSSPSPPSTLGEEISSLFSSMRTALKEKEAREKHAFSSLL